MILSRIINEKRRIVQEAKNVVSQEDLSRQAHGIYVQSAFKRNVSRPHRMNLIAEMKKASPSQGIIRGDFNPVRIAVTYETNGAGAISVLTDERFFEGRLEYIRLVKERTSLPVLRKDFIIDEYQIYETVVAGADAMLLIAEILSSAELARFFTIGKGFGIDIMVEVHSEEDIEKALSVRADIIGINNRDLHTFKVDVGCTQRLIRLIPKDTVIVSESGIKTYEDVMFLKSLGVNAVLIGEAFMVSDDIAAKMREIMRG